MSIIIERRICLDHDKLNQNIKTYLLEKIIELTTDECTKEYGYILNIKRLIRITDNYISNVNCENVFVVSFEVENLKPENGKQFTGNVCMIFPGGIFLNIQNKQKVLIPISSLKNYSFDMSKKQFINGSKSIKENDIIDVIITGTKYTKQSFSCFGTMIEK